jgi:AraC family transcriptional regulator
MATNFAVKIQVEQPSYRGSGFTFHRRFTEKHSIPQHEHDKHTVQLQTKGPVRFESHDGGKTRCVILQAGAISLFPKGTRHAVSYSDEIDQLTLNIDPERMIKGFGDALLKSTLELQEREELKDTRIEHLLHALRQDWEEGSPTGSLYGEWLVNAISVCLATRYATCSLDSSASASVMPKSRLNRVLAYVDANMEETVHLSTLAEAAGMSIYHFAKLFKASTGMSPHQYVLRRRIEHAKELLRKPGLSLSEISLRAGFSDQSHLTNVFRRFVGVTPFRFRGLLQH